ncbi:hypothetical protein E2C01_079051 [Portunus trituberculatus]|uniref:Uncharacterized protein n=1 Tax=Portunus trituberculatus TaxID=210409 RepID=A0A5B7IVT3_PORTR|nr:hypothetical protein [Portunus trituberculatus]
MLNKERQLLSKRERERERERFKRKLKNILICLKQTLPVQCQQMFGSNRLFEAMDVPCVEFTSGLPGACCASL